MGAGALSTVFRRNKNVAGRVIDGQAFIITPNDNRMHTLNRTAAELWEYAKEGWTVEVAAERLSRRFRVEKSTAAADVEKCAADLVSRGILVTE